MKWSVFAIVQFALGIACGVGAFFAQDWELAKSNIIVWTLLGAAQGLYSTSLLTAVKVVRDIADQRTGVSRRPGPLSLGPASPRARTRYRSRAPESGRAIMYVTEAIMMGSLAFVILASAIIVRDDLAAIYVNPRPLALPSGLEWLSWAVIIAIPPLTGYGVAKLFAADLVSGMQEHRFTQMLGDAAGIVMGVLSCVWGWFTAFAVWVFAVWLVPLFPQVAN